MKTGRVVDLFGAAGGLAGILIPIEFGILVASALIADILDSKTTFDLYKHDRLLFSKIETNRMFVKVVTKIGFIRAAICFWLFEFVLRLGGSILLIGWVISAWGLQGFEREFASRIPYAIASSSFVIHSLGASLNYLKFAKNQSRKDCVAGSK